jgi:hypothetical protein
MFSWVTYAAIAKKVVGLVKGKDEEGESDDLKTLLGKQVLKKALKEKDKIIQAQNEVINEINKTKSSDNMDLAIKRMRGKNL